MRKVWKKRALGIALSAAMIAGSLAGCGSKEETASNADAGSTNEKYADTITIDVFDSQAQDPQRMVDFIDWLSSSV